MSLRKKISANQFNGFSNFELFLVYVNCTFSVLNTIKLFLKVYENKI